MASNQTRNGISFAGAMLFFVLVLLFQVLFEWVFGDAIDARFFAQAAFTAALMTVLFVLFDRWRRRRRK